MVDFSPTESREETIPYSRRTDTEDKGVTILFVRRTDTEDKGVTIPRSKCCDNADDLWEICPYLPNENKYLRSISPVQAITDTIFYMQILAHEG